ncbi:MAG: preprotein translocase subunit SecG [Clostridia bacterium]
MGWIDWTLSILTIIVGIIVTTVVMMQSSKTGESSVTSGNTFYGSNKSKTIDGALSKWTVILSFVFILLCVLTTISIMK